MGSPRAASHHGPDAGAPVVTPEIAAEAAVWVARLHGPDRCSRMEAECLAWQARSAAHGEAFERCTETWLDVPRVTLDSVYAAAAAAAGPVRGVRRRWTLRTAPWTLAMAVAAVALGGAAAFQHWLDRGTYGTGVGEQEQVLLADGTRMSLNTDTRVRVDLGAVRRRVSLQHGEALFEVAPDPRRPFVVRVAGSEVVATGTVFDVRFTSNGTAGPGHAARTLAVTLIQGKVTVRPVAGSAGNGIAPHQAVTMQPGQRMRVDAAADAGAPGALPRLDRPSLEEVIAWRRSEALFDNVALSDAIAEMNRYSRTPIVLVGGPALARLQVSGLYRTGDNAGFARAVAALHGLSVRERNGRLELASTH